MNFDDRPEPAKRLEKARIAKGLKSAREAALRYGFSPFTYAQHENGTRGIVRAVERYAKAYGVSEAWLLGLVEEGSEAKPPQPPADDPNAALTQRIVGLTDDQRAAVEAVISSFENSRSRKTR